MLMNEQYPLIVSEVPSFGHLSAMFGDSNNLLRVQVGLDVDFLHDHNVLPLF